MSVELDPEQQYSAFSHERQAEPSADDLEAGRADYVAVGKSKLRADIKNGRGEEDELEKSRRYAGRRASRKELYDDSEESDAGEEDDEVSELEGEEEDDEDEEDAASGEDEEENEEMANQDDDEAEESEDEDKDEDEAPRKKKDSSSSAALATSLRAAASADVQKGQDIKKQLLFCDGLLESRIRLHKAVAAQAKLPTPPTARPVYEQLKSKVDETMQEVEALSESLFLLRQVRFVSSATCSPRLPADDEFCATQEMMEANENVVMPDDFGTSRKRKRGVDSEQYVGATLNDLAALEHRCVLWPALAHTYLGLRQELNEDVVHAQLCAVLPLYAVQVVRQGPRRLWGGGWREQQKVQVERARGERSETGRRRAQEWRARWQRRARAPAASDSRAKRRWRHRHGGGTGGRRRGL